VLHPQPQGLVRRRGEWDHVQVGDGQHFKEKSSRHWRPLRIFPSLRCTIIKMISDEKMVVWELKYLFKISISVMDIDGLLIRSRIQHFNSIRIRYRYSIRFRN
jgi:hypothetical protein